MPFVFSSNGHLYVEFDRFTGMTCTPRPLSAFPTPAELQSRYEVSMGFHVSDLPAAPLLVQYKGGDSRESSQQDNKLV